MPSHIPEIDNSSDKVKASNTSTGTQPLHSGRGNQIVFTGPSPVHIERLEFYSPADAPEEQTQTARNIVKWLNSQAAPFHKPYVQQLHSNFQQQRVAEIGTWVLDSDELKDWKIKRRMLWMHGIFGSGKTMLASLIIDHLSKRVESRNDTACIFFYFQRETRQPTVVQVLACLLAQLLQQRIVQGEDDQCADGLRTVHAKYQAHEPENPLPVEELLKLLGLQSALFKQVYLVIDALDNYESSLREQKLMLDTIQSLPCHVKILITTASGPAVANILQTSRDYELLVRSHGTDIEDYVRYRIDEDENLQRLVRQGQAEEPGFKEKVIKCIRLASKEVILVATLHINGLRNQRSLGDFNTALKKPPEGLPQVFNSAIERIKNQSSESDRAFSRHVLTWLVYAARPMKVKELLHSFAITKAENASDRHFDRPPEDLTSVCEGLAFVNPRDEVVRLVHDSVQDLLQKAGLLSREPYTMMARQCLKYLLSDDFSKEASSHDDVQERKRRYAFLPYAAEYWKAILQQQNGDGVAEVEEQAMQLLRHDRKVTSWFQTVVKDAPAKVSGLHALVYFDCGTWAGKLIEEGMDVNTTCSQGQTPLHWAAGKGLASFVDLLLRKSARPDIRDANENTPLHMAITAAGSRAGSKYKRVIAQLVAQDAGQMNVRNKGKGGLTPFEQVIKHGPVWAMRILAEHQPVTDVVGNERDWSPFRQAMSLADPKWKFCIVSSLLQGGAFVKQSGRCLWHPMIAAAQAGTEDIVSLLLKYGALTNVEDYNGSTPLEAAIIYGYARIAQLLIDHGANVQRKDKDGSTPLIQATKHCRSRIVWLLLDKKANADEQDSSGSTALHYSVDHRDNSITWLLAIRNASPIIRNLSGFSALDLAALQGDSWVSWILLNNRGTGGENEDVKREASTALCLAAKQGHQRVVHLLLTYGVDINATSADGMTALAHAALERRRDMIQYLLRERASSDIQDQNGATALHHAVKPGDERDIIYMLLKAGAKVDIQDSRKKTALMLAAELGREEDAHVLLKFGASLDIRDAEGQTAKDIAKERGWEMIVAIMEHPLASQRNLGTEAGGA